MTMKKDFIFHLYLLISAIFGYVYSVGNQQEKQFLRSPTYRKTSSILRDILKQESSLQFSMVQKIQNLVTDAIENNNVTEILRKRLVSLGNKVNSIQSENRKLENALDASLEHFHEDQNETNLQLQNVPSVPKPSHHCFYPFDCFDIYNCGERGTDVYDIYPFTAPVSTKVLCDMDSNGGGWTVIQRRHRENRRVEFNTTWNEYKIGFGDARGNYWLVDAFRKHLLINQPFSTYDHDNNNRCAAKSGSGWWYNFCTHKGNDELSSENSKIKEQLKFLKKIEVASLRNETIMLKQQYDSLSQEKERMECKLNQVEKELRSTYIE
ncbi:angiopoietin-related protein 7-like, partial [Saccostrea cucullata]|uniref:angiopoietin-related protein 7-like n=1 Tax=Saccostrea cuccullata TaxID=36930 RepID=UPI002ED3A1EB